MVSRRASGRRVSARTYEPDSTLADVVASCWKGSWALADQQPHESVLLGDPCAHFVFEDGTRAGHEARLVGVWTQLWRRTLEGEGRVFGVKLRAGALRAFVDRPAHTISNRMLALRDLFDVVPARQVLTAPDDDTAFGVFERWLQSARLDYNEEKVGLAVELAETVAQTPSVMRVEQLSERAGLAVRPLQRLFRDFVGASPKWVIRRHRLQELAARLEAGASAGLAEVSIELGYTDQAHMSRDFKTAVGMTPTEFLQSLD